MMNIQQEKSPYWQYVIDPAHDLFSKLTALMNRYPLEHGGYEFILHPTPAVDLLDELTSLRISVFGVNIWCYVADMSNRDGCCPDGMGGPGKLENGIQGAFLEYTHLGYEVPDFKSIPHTLDLADVTNPLVRHYLIHQLPLERGYTPDFRVTLYLHTPLWKFFPTT